VNRLICELDGLALVSPYNHLAAAERGLRGLPGILVTTLPVMLSGLGVFLLARRLLEGRATEDELQVALRGLPHNPTTEMDLVLWEMATRVHKDESSRAALAEIDASELSRQYLASKLPPLLQSELSDFLTRYGHRGIAEIDIGVPRWSEDPAHILGTLANYLRLDRADVAPDAQFARRAREAEDMISLLQTRASGLRGVLVGVLLRRTRALAGYREMPKFLAVLGFSHARRHLLSVGSSLAGQGRIEQAEDAFFLTLPEAREGLDGRDLRAMVAERRASYEHERLRRHVPRAALRRHRAGGQSVAAGD
jgi:pyruvate,water dikinase